MKTTLNTSGSPSEFRRRMALLTCLCAYLCEGINTSIMAPLFPPHALDLGLTETQIGLAQGMFDIASFIGQFMIASVITPQTRKMFYAVGIFVSGVSIILFGYTGNETRPEYFFALCVCVRAMMGFGACLVYSGTVPLVNKLYPEKAGILTSVAQSALGFGAMIGPPLGSSLSSLGNALGWNGYSVPYYLYGGFETSLTIMVVLFVPAASPFTVDKGKKVIPKHLYFKFITTKTLLCLSVPVIALFAIAGFKDVAYSPYFEESVGVRSDLIGYVFMAISATYLTCSPIWGMAIQKGYVGVALTFAFCSGSVGMFLFYLPLVAPGLVNLYYSLAVLLLNGLMLSALFGSCYLVFEKIAERNGFRDMETNKLMVASWYSTVRSSGRITGSFLVGGVILQGLEFHYTCLFYSIFIAIGACIAVFILYNNGFYKKVFYTIRNEDYEMQMSDSTVVKVAIPKNESLIESTLKRTMISIEAV
ncbi:MFS-type transporter SLC18B1-like isoform X2 [Convolutriloba macropyga]|uniref:MFS-type transporter SLC18B1-like isoform X2 n=1 Tax=Convolutriloba macropyga TaxID=536237 RepID=UPI003F51ED5C